MPGIPARGIDVWMKHNARPDASFRLICLPPSGVGASLFQSWYRYLPPQIDVCAIQLPGREDRFREPPYKDLKTLVHELGEVLRSCFDRPFAFYGHSMGAIIAFELARELRRLTIPGPAHFFAAAYRAPHLPSREAPIRALPDGEFFAELSRRYKAMPDEVLESQELMELLIIPLRADFTMLEEWSFADEPPLNCPLTTFGGLTDESVTGDELAAWSSQTRSTFDRSMLPGGHFFARDSCQLLLQKISNRLAPYLRT
jgi:surfactin synthase thioesterase subunit